MCVFVYFYFGDVVHFVWLMFWSLVILGVCFFFEEEPENWVTREWKGLEGLEEEEEFDKNVFEFSSEKYDNKKKMNIENKIYIKENQQKTKVI